MNSAGPQTVPGTPPGTRRRPRARLEARALWHSIGAVRWSLAILALLAFALSGSMVAGDRLVAAHTADSYHAYLRAQPSAQTDVSAVSTMTSASAATLAQATARTDALLPPHLVGAVTAVHTSVIDQSAIVRAPSVSAGQTVTWPPLLNLSYSPQAASAVHYIRGSAPKCPAGGCAAPAAVPIAIAQPVATTLHLGVGSRLVLDSSDHGTLTVQISGIFEPSTTGSSAPADASGVSAPASIESAFDDLPTLRRPRLSDWVPAAGPYAGLTNLQWNAEALIDPEALAAVTGWQPAHVTWRYHLLPATLAASSAATLADEVKSRISSANLLGLGGAFSADVFSSHLPPTLAGFAALDAGANALADFALAGTAAIALAVLFLAISMLLVRQSAAVALLRARGASGPVLAGWVGLPALLVCVPATALAFLVFRALIHPTGSGSGHTALQGAVVAVTAVGAPLLAAVLAGRTPRAVPVSRRRRRATRWIGRGTALLVGVASVAGVRLRAGTGGGLDPLTVLLPTILAVDAAVLISFLIPPAVRPAARLAARGRGLVGYLSAASAARRPTVDLVTAGALTAAATAAVFASCFTGTLCAARVAQSWQSVGADLRISADGQGAALDQAALDKVAAAPGIAAHAEAAVLTEQQLVLPQGGVQITVYLIDPTRYRGLIQGTPLDTPALAADLASLSAGRGGAGGVPALVSPDLLGLIQAVPAGTQVSLELSSGLLNLAALGSAAAFPPASHASATVVLSAAGVGRALPNFQAAPDIAWYTYRPGATGTPAAAAKVAGATVATRAAVIGGYGNDLLSALSAWISRAAGLLDVVLAGTCILLAAAATARKRAATGAFLLAVGTRQRAAAAIGVLETVPMLIAVGAAAVGAGYGATEALLPALAVIGGVPQPDAATIPLDAVLAAAAVPLLGVLVVAAGAGFGRRTRLSFHRTDG